MEALKKIKTLKILLFVLIVFCAVQAWVIYKYLLKPSPNADIFNNTKSFLSFLDEKFKKDKQENWSLYDRFFNDDFFSKQRNPFHEMERMQKQLEEMMGMSSEQNFSNFWQDWFDDRFGSSSTDIDINTNEKKNLYEITITIPNLKDNNLKINIDENNISVEGDFSQTVEKKDKNGNIISSHELRQSLSRKFPVPSDAETSTAKVENQKDQIIIKLPKK